jgi:hypothetical protein
VPRVRRTGQDGYVTAEYVAESFPQGPHSQGPGNRGGRREPGGPAEEESDSESNLSEGKGRIKQPRLDQNEPRVFKNQPMNPLRLAGCRRFYDLRSEVSAEHERLKLQDSVQ